MILKIMRRGFLGRAASPSAQGFTRFFRIFPRIFRVFPRIFRELPRLSLAVGRRYKRLRPALLLWASYPVLLHAVTQLLRVHTQQHGRTMHARDPPVGRLQGR